jgi:predicted PolB exonuclease-like 3'-5' exonuclease
VGTVGADVKSEPEFELTILQLRKKQISPLMNADYTDKKGQFWSNYISG